MKRVSRRTFARDAVIVAGAAAVMPHALAEEKPAPPSPEVEARIQWIFTKYGSRLDEAQRADIRRLATVHGENDVAFLQAGSCQCGVSGNFQNQHARNAGQAER